MRNFNSFRNSVTDSLGRIDSLAATLRAADPSMTEAQAQMKAYEQLRAKEREQSFAVVRAKAEALVKIADLGRKMNIRLDRKTVLEGELIAARVAEVRQNGNTVEAIFEVDLKCGISSFPRTVRVGKLPTTR